MELIASVPQTIFFCDKASGWPLAPAAIFESKVSINSQSPDFILYPKLVPT